MRSEQIEIRLVAQRRFELEAEPHVVAPRLFLHQHDQRSLAVDLLHRVVDRLEISAPKDTCMSRSIVSRFSGSPHVCHRLQHDGIADEVSAFNLYRFDRQRGDCCRAACRARTAAYCSGGSDNARKRSATLRAAASPIGTVFTIVEIGGRIVAKLRQDQISFAVISASERLTFCSVRMLIICSDTLSTDVI